MINRLPSSLIITTISGTRLALSCCRVSAASTHRNSGGGVLHSRLFYRTKTSAMASATSFYDFKPLDKKSQPYDLSQLKNKVVLIVNTASKCGFTPQFEGLETLYRKISASHPSSSTTKTDSNSTSSSSDFIILGFPCNQFMSQDPADNDTIQSFCLSNYGVSFPILAKTDVNGPNAEPLYEFLKSEAPGVLGLKRIKWNFEKFLVGRDGKVVGRWASTTKPEALEGEILKALKKQGKSEL